MAHQRDKASRRTALFHSKTKDEKKRGYKAREVQCHCSAECMFTHKRSDGPTKRIERRKVKCTPIEITCGGVTWATRGNARKGTVCRKMVYTTARSRRIKRNRTRTQDELIQSQGRQQGRPGRGLFTRSRDLKAKGGANRYKEGKQAQVLVRHCKK